MKRILITGSRNWTDREAIWRALDRFDVLAMREEVKLITGGCPTGADRLAESMWWGPVECHPCDGKCQMHGWSHSFRDLGKRAGPVRNKIMVDLGADICLAFPLPDSRGTLNCMRLARDAGIPVEDHGVRS